MNSVKEHLDEAKRTSYPPQYDDEYLLEYANITSGLSVGGLSPQMQKFHQKVISAHQKLWQKTFGEKTPWSVDTSKRKPKVIWNQSKANKLGLD